MRWAHYIPSWVSGFVWGASLASIFFYSWYDIRIHCPGKIIDKRSEVICLLDRQVPDRR